MRVYEGRKDRHLSSYGNVVHRSVTYRAVDEVLYTKFGSAKSRDVTQSPTLNMINNTSLTVSITHLVKQY